MESRIDPDIIKKIRGIEIKAKQLVNTTFSGEFKTAFKGRGIEFDEVREYVAGDDVRKIDWNVTARSYKPYIKTFRDERELIVLFLVDLSHSSHFGSSSKFKNEIIAEITAALASMALRSNDKVGLLIFTDKIEFYIPPKKGRSHIWRLIREILSFSVNGKGTNISIPLKYINRVLKKRAICFLISDFNANSFEKELSVTSKRHELVAISVKDAREFTLPSVSNVDLYDLESGEPISVNTSNIDLASAYRDSAIMEKESTKKLFRKYGVDFLDIPTSGNYVDSLVQFFRERGG